MRYGYWLPVFGGWLRNVRGHQHGMHKPPEKGGCSQGSENKSDATFHRFCFDHSAIIQ